MPACRGWRSGTRQWARMAAHFVLFRVVCRFMGLCSQLSLKTTVMRGRAWLLIYKPQARRKHREIGPETPWSVIVLQQQGSRLSSWPLKSLHSDCSRWSYCNHSHILQMCETTLMRLRLIGKCEIMLHSLQYLNCQYCFPRRTEELVEQCMLGWSYISS